MPDEGRRFPKLGFGIASQPLIIDPIFITPIFLMDRLLMGSTSGPSNGKLIWAVDRVIYITRS